MCDEAPSANSIGIGDTVAATSNIRIGGALVVQKGCSGTAACHAERSDGSVGVSVRFEVRQDGGDTNVLCQPHEINVVAKAPSANSFSIGDFVAATSDFRIGGSLAVAKGGRGTVICHGERPDGSIGVSIHFEARSDGSDANVLCLPHQIQVVAKATEAQSTSVYATLVGNHLQRAWESMRASSMSFCAILPSSPSTLSGIIAKCSRRARLPSTPVTEKGTIGVDGSRLLPRTSSKDVKHRALVSGGSALRRRKTSDRNHIIRPVDDNDEFDFEAFNDKAREKPDQQRWSMLIALLVLANLVFGYVHLQRRAGRANRVTVDTLTDDSFWEYVASHPNGTLVNFHFPSCRPCAKLAPEFQEAAMRVQGSGVSLAALDVDLAPSILRLHSVKVFPALLWFRQGKFLRAAESSVRDAAGITEFVQEALQPAVIVFSDHDQLDEALPQLRSIMARGKTAPVVVGFGRDRAVHEVVEEMAEKFRGLTAFLFVKKAQGNDPFIRTYFRDAKDDKEYNAALTVQDS